MAVDESTVLRFGDGGDWHFVNASWEDAEGGLLRVPVEQSRLDSYSLQGHNYAFYQPVCYRDVRLRFELRLTAHSDVGVILRARDESHFYLLHFPNCGQARRAQHFWVAFSRMDDSGYLKIVKLEMIRRVPSNDGLWLPAEVTLSGNKVAVRIGKHGYFEAGDDTYPDPGRIGVFSFCGWRRGSAVAMRNVAVEGNPLPPTPWNKDARQPTNWFHPCPDADPKLWQTPGDLVRFPDGELLLSYNLEVKPGTGEHQGLTVGCFWSRSLDGGRTWSLPEARPAGDRLHLTPGGRLIAMRGMKPGYFVAESYDRGRTWFDFVPAGLAPLPPHIEGLHLGPQAFLNLDDGSIVLFAYGARHDVGRPDLTVNTWGAHHCQAFACRSADDGRTWSPWVNLDNAGFELDADESDPERAHGRPVEGNLDLTEVCAAQATTGEIMALIRPIYSPWMWETWSADGGATWGPCLRGPFAGYATSNMLRTSSGALLVAHRLPSMTIHVSRDDGHTWDQGTLIDSAVWVMGTMVEVEPDLVLYVYFDSFESRMRGQFIQVTPTGLEPVRVATASAAI